MTRAAGALLAIAIASGCSSAKAPEELVVAAPYDLTSLDPHRDNTVSNYSVLSNVYEPLVVTDADTRVRPALAQSWENPDPLTWLLHLRRGVRFHSGRELRAEDAVASVRRLLDEPDLDIRAFVTEVAEVDAPAPLTLRIRTHRPTRVLLNKLSFALVVPEGSTTAGLDARPDGTGPWQVESWVRGDRIRLRRFGGYWSRQPSIERASFHFPRPGEDLVKLLADGEVHLAQGGSELQARLGELPHHDARWHENIYVKYFGMDLGRDETPFVPGRPNPFLDPRVRRAIHVGIDRNELVAALPNRASPASQPVRQFIFGFDPSLEVPRHDPEQARALLAQAGLAEGFSGVLHVRRPFEAGARALAPQLARLGIRLDVRVIPDSEYFARQRTHELSAWITRYGCPTGDASDVLENLIHSEDPARRLGDQNEGRFSDPAVDRLVEDTARYESPADRRQALQRALRAAMDALPVVPLYTDQDLYVLDRRFRWTPRNDSYIRLSEFSRAP